MILPKQPYRIFYISILLVLLVSCSARKERRIKDTWKYIEVKDVAKQEYYEVWDLSEGEEIVITKYPIYQATNPIEIGRGRYVIQKAPFSPFYIEIFDIGPYYDGKWEVLKIKSDEMVLLLDQFPYWIYREFEIY